MAKSKKKKTDTPIMTPRQLEILTCIRDSRKINGYSPTLQEIADELGISKITVFEHVEALLEKGVLSRVSNKARSLEITPLAQFPDERPTLIPLLGTIAAGRPITAFPQPDLLDLEDFVASRHPIGALMVSGDSMIDDQIRDGDCVLFEQRSDARNGQTVVALVDGENATLKRFYKEKNRIRLQPANARYKPIYPRHVQVQGVVIGVIRRF